MTRVGPLAGVRVLELAGLGPGPFAGMMLSDMGADVLRVERPGAADPLPHHVTARGRPSIELDLKDPRDVELCLELAERADILFEGFRPGVMERLGLGPEDVAARNRALVYGRMTGWGQTGPSAPTAGHDINYIALSGALHAIGPRDKPIAPLNLVGDYGGGALFLVSGLLAALIHARSSGEGQVVDAGMSDSSAYLMSSIFATHAAGLWNDERQANLLDGDAPFYDTYRCRDGRWIALGAIEPQFFAQLIARLGISPADVPDQWDRSRWPQLREQFTDAVSRKTREEWIAIFDGIDACFAPVLNLREAPNHPHNMSRETFQMVANIPHPAPSPRFSRTGTRPLSAPRAISRDARPVLERWGISACPVGASSES